MNEDKEKRKLPDTPEGNTGESCTVCHVRLRPESPPLTYAVRNLNLREGEWVLVPTDHGPEVGQVMKHPVTLKLTGEHIPPYVKRLATTSEIEDYYKNLELEQQGRKVCQQLINRLGLKMKLVRVERFFDGSKIIFYYSADGRVDFRELVKELVKELRIRVEMRQIGIRHEAKLIGGIGCCGRELCCASFLTGFDPISIKMAKAQNLPLNPSKISGFCGRLLCCLTYEYETYKEMSQDLPTLGKACETPEGQGKVVRHNIFRQAVTVAMPDGSFVEYTVQELDGSPPSPAEQPDQESPKKQDQKNTSSGSHNKRPKRRSGKKTQRKKKKPRQEKGTKKTGSGKPAESKAPGKKGETGTQKEKKARKKSGRKRSHKKKRSGRKNHNKKGDTGKS